MTKVLIYQPVMEDIIKRIQQLMLDDKIESKKGLAQKIGRSAGTVSDNLSSGDSITDNFLIRLQTKLGWSAQWIQTGIGPKRIPKATPSLASDVYHNSKSAKSDNADTELVNDPGVRVLGVNDPDRYVEVPILRYRVWASFVDNFNDFNFKDIEETYPVYLPDLDKPPSIDDLVFEILGDSMEPTIMERAKVLGDVIDDGNVEYINSGIYIVAYRNKCVVKRIIDNNLLIDGTLTLHSDNPKHGKITIRRDDIRRMWRVVRIVDSVPR